MIKPEQISYESLVLTPLFQKVNSKNLKERNDEPVGAIQSAGEHNGTANEHDDFLEKVERSLEPANEHDVVWSWEFPSFKKDFQDDELRRSTRRGESVFL